MKRETQLLLRASAAGAACALLFILTGLVLRLLFGVATLDEMIGDRVAPLLGIPLFFKMLNLFRGYNHLKQFGFLSVLAGQGVTLVVAAVVIAHLARRRLVRPAVAVSAAAVAGCVLCIALLWPNLATSYIGLDPSRATITNILALVFECALAAWFLTWSLTTWASPDAESFPSDRRRLLLVEAGSALAALALVGILFRFFRIAAYAYDGTENTGEDLPAITPNKKFYAVTKNNVDPMPTVAAWSLRIDGSVAHPRTLTLSDLEALPAIQQEVTLQCISNSIGGGLNSNAIWTGVRLKDLLQDAGASPSAVQVTFHGADGFTDDVPLDKAMDSETMLAYKMNGDPLPSRHGFPARLIVPGYVGEKSVKWITRIEVAAHKEKGFYEQQGWGPQFTLNNTARIDSPDLSDPVDLGSVVRLKGIAFAGDRGVSRVQVSTDSRKTWRDAEVTYRGAQTAWVQWQLLWKPDTAGETKVAVRCIDGDGKVQSGVTKGSGPEPATGYHEVKATVKA